MGLLIDMNMSPGWEAVFTAAGLEARHWSRLGKAWDVDETILDYARDEGWIVFTSDRDFGKMLFTGNLAWPSVVQVRPGNLRPSEIGSIVVDAVLRERRALAQGAFVSIDARRLRVRILPLRDDDP